MTEDPEPAYCDFCRLPRPAETVEATVDGERYHFCSAHCRDAMLGADRVFTRYHGHRRFQPGVAAIDAVLPQGCPRNAFVLCSGQAGTRSGAIQAELVWRALQRGEPAVVVTFQEPPASVVERFVTLDWNVIPYLETGQLRVVDCFSYRMADRSDSPGRVSTWNSHLADAVRPVTERVRDPTDIDAVTSKLASALDGGPGRDAMVETGVVVVDSLTELGSLVQPVQAYDFVKDVRALVCKARFVPVFACATYAGDPETFPHDLAYGADGLIDLKLDGDVVEDGLVKRLRVRKLDGVLSYQRWTAYEFTAGRGMVAFDPQAELAASTEAAVQAVGVADAAADAASDTGTATAEGSTTAPAGDAGTDTEDRAVEMPDGDTDDGGERTHDSGDGDGTGGEDGSGPEDPAADGG